MKTLIVLVAALVCGEFVYSFRYCCPSLVDVPLSIARSISAHSFTIPLLFGGISVNKGPDGNVGIGFKNAINVNGNGFDRNTNFNVGKGKFDVQGEPA